MRREASFWGHVHALERVDRLSMNHPCHQSYSIRSISLWLQVAAEIVPTTSAVLDSESAGTCSSVVVLIIV